MQVVTSSADRLGNTLAPSIDEAGDLLKTGTRRSDDTDIPASHDVGEGERDAIDDGGPAIRSHDNEIVVLSETFQRNFIVQLNMVAKYHHIEAKTQGFERLSSGVFAGRGDQCQIGANHVPEPHFYTAGGHGR